MLTYRNKSAKTITVFLIVLILSILQLGFFGTVEAINIRDYQLVADQFAASVTGDDCGSTSTSVHLSINIGCRGEGNAILDMLFAFIRVLSVGVGLVIIGSIILAGVQYTTSRGDPQATAKALGRVYNTFGALLLFIFAYAILNWLVPGAILQ